MGGCGKPPASVRTFDQLPVPVVGRGAQRVEIKFNNSTVTQPSDLT